MTSLYGELEAKADRLLTVSHSFRSYLAPYVQDAERIQVIPNGFDERRFKPVAHENEVPQLITVCRLVPAKGLDVLLHACAKLKSQGHPFMLHIIGDGPIRKELEQLAVSLGLYDDIIFTVICCTPNNSCRSSIYSCFLPGRKRSVRYLPRRRFVGWRSSERMSGG
ncbi:hypothetical protein PACILC2_20480 [Paenibacillus cisolokensis]|uniref:Glycosyl transferase family 1 domain-containing protein n=1 Tax=Paenibacillus cisolokensis TaxID=1658519 RepID=A0ABQ4N5J3_9BACL|nr:hypothetical protein PACILC2_20480 [Paenibacillus cisolokensis]